MLCRGAPALAPRGVVDARAAPARGGAGLRSPRARRWRQRAVVWITAHRTGVARLIASRGRTRARGHALTSRTEVAGHDDGTCQVGSYAREPARRDRDCGARRTGVAFDSRLPTSAEVNDMNAASATRAVRFVSLDGSGPGASIYVVDGKRVTAAQAN